ncbi:MAG: SPFH domain-containing protein [Coriobacteriia bacterium]|nr:SPFH domain-containing protein [Coriobacteriia bacterium]
MPVADIIQFQGPIDSLVWKSPVENFNSTTQLIVDETHEAIVMIEGRTEIYAEGRHTLASPNIPGAEPIQRLATGGDTPFTCKVFFVDKVHAMDLRWGTSAPIEVEDPVYKILIHVMMNGSMGFVIDDSMKFVRKFTGFQTQFDSEALVKKFRGIISTFVKDCIARMMTEGGIGYYGINAYLRDIGDLLGSHLVKQFDDYGIRLTYFNVEDIQTPAADTAVLAQAKARQAGRVVEGYSWQQEQQAEIAKGVANNQGSMGDVMGAAAGFMVGGAMGGTVADVARSVLSDSWNKSDSPLKGDPDASAGGQSTPKPPTGRFDVQGIYDGRDKAEAKPEAEAQEDDSAPAPSANCLFCGKPLAPGASFCGYCGKPQGRTCDACGATVTQPGQKFCGTCGGPLPE